MAPPYPWKVLDMARGACDYKAYWRRIGATSVGDASQPASIWIKLEWFSFPANPVTTRTFMPLRETYCRDSYSRIDQPGWRNLFHDGRESEVAYTELGLKSGFRYGQRRVARGRFPIL